MIETMRWFGPRDPVSLLDIRQAGCSGVVTALHQIPVGEVWPVKSILERKNLIEQAGLRWMVAESLPVHEDIKKGVPARQKWIENYQQSLRHLAACGVQTVCYNFMPVLDWSRTDVDYALPNGAKSLRFVWADFIVFDLFILRRPGAHESYTPEEVSFAEKRFQTKSPAELKKLQQTVLLGLPGSEEAFELDKFQGLLDKYQGIGADQLKENLFHFIRQVGPVAEELDLRLGIHPDDPPRSLLGLPRVVSTEDDLAAVLAVYPGRNHGLTFCTGSLGVRADNELVSMICRFADRIHFAHLRATKREENPLDFHEAEHLNGDVDMYSVVKALLIEEQRRQALDPEFQLPFRPDHGHQLLDDLSKKTYPGYSAIGRLKGLAEIRGLATAIKASLNRVA